MGLSLESRDGQAMKDRLATTLRVIALILTHCFCLWDLTRCFEFFE